MTGRAARLTAATVLAVVAGAAAQPATELTASERALLGAPAGRALTGAELAERTQAVARLMRCPVCQGLSVADSHTLAATAMRGKIERLLAAGYSEEQVLADFEASYGEFIRLSPRVEGFNVAVWIAPIVVVLAGALVIATRIRRARARSGGSAELEALRERVRQEASR